MAPGDVPPLEAKDAYGGFFPALWHTWVNACFRPTAFFETVGNSQDLTPALLCGVLFGWAGLVFTQLWGLIFRAAVIAVVPPREGAASALVGSVGGLMCAGLFGWLIALAVICLDGLLFHLFLWLLGGANRGVVVTLRVVAYAQAPQIFSAVPLIGGCIAVIWTFVLQVVGLAAAHRTDLWRAVAAVIAPIVCLCVLAVLASGIAVLLLKTLLQPQWGP